MKHIKIWVTLLLINLPLIAQGNFTNWGNTNRTLVSYFAKVFEDEKGKFLQCVALENLPSEDQIYTDCKISEPLMDSAHILSSTKRLDSCDVLENLPSENQIKTNCKISRNPVPSDLLDKFKKFQKKRDILARYPKDMIQKEEDGYVIIKFDINQLGNTENHEIQEGLCGKLIDPQTELKPCESFNNSSLQAAKKLKYLPTSYKKMPITHKGVKHRFTFTMSGISNPNIQISSESARAYSKLLSAIKKNDFNTALSIANKNIENDSYFIYQKAAIKFSQKKYIETMELLEKFQLSAINQGKEIGEQYYVSAFSMLVTSLFSLGRYQEIIDLEKNYKIYSTDWQSSRLNYSSDSNSTKKMLSMTNFYMGIAYINTGNIPKGAYYMTLASRNASSKGQSDYYDSFIDQISSYL
jgi:hypothetical protein